MDRATFEAELRQQGYAETVDRRMEANAVNPEHAHEFDARLLVLEGAMTITAEGQHKVAYLHALRATAQNTVSRSVTINANDEHPFVGVQRQVSATQSFGKPSRHIHALEPHPSG